MKVKFGSDAANNPHPDGETDSAYMPAPPASPQEKLAWLRLIRTPQIGPVRFWEILANYGSAVAALEDGQGLAAFSRRLSSGTPFTEADAQAELAMAARHKLHPIAFGEAGYPPLLAQSTVPPPLLYMKGHTEVWQRPPIAIVGSRQASAAGMKLASAISEALARVGCLVVSGLARGIDGAAHRATVAEGTAAVLAGGVDMIYPPEHVGLAEEIAKTGVLVSECAPGFVARSEDFPRRNRIIAGSCLGVVIVEAAEKSGSLITARLAVEHNREVFAAPGHPLDPRAAGPNALIRQGATLVRSADDVLEALSLQLRNWREHLSPMPAASTMSYGAHAATPIGDLPEQGTRCASAARQTIRAERGAHADDPALAVLRALSVAPVDLDDLIRATGLDSRAVNAAIMTLDLEGRIQRQRSGRIALAP